MKIVYFFILDLVSIPGCKAIVLAFYVRFFCHVTTTMFILAKNTNIFSIKCQQVTLLNLVFSLVSRSFS